MVGFNLSARILVFWGVMLLAGTCGLSLFMVIAIFRCAATGSRCDAAARGKPACCVPAPCCLALLGPFPQPLFLSRSLHSPTITVAAALQVTLAGRAVGRCARQGCSVVVLQH